VRKDVEYLLWIKNTEAEDAEMLKNVNIWLYKLLEVGVWASSRTPYTVELLFEKEIGAYALDRKWHSTQTVESRDDGRVYVKFTTTQMPEVLRWALGQGHTVKALELVERVKAEAEKVRGIYERE
jgi:predicted DNA-binding transcriptional regulator YafY